MSTPGVRLLVIDWDFFFLDLGGSPSPEGFYLYDWSHQESSFYIDGPVWANRAAAFLSNKKSLPGLSGEERSFWSRFSFAPGAQLFTADSNAYAAHDTVADGVETVWLYDAHHDAGYVERAELYGRTNIARIKRRYKEAAGRWTCDDWMVFYAGQGAELAARYPTWKTWAFDSESEPLLDGDCLDRQFATTEHEPLITFDRVLVCRSGAWVPPWHDRAFERFIRNAPRGLARTELQPTPRRAFSLTEIEKQVKLVRLLRDDPAAFGLPTGGACSV